VQHHEPDGILVLLSWHSVYFVLPAKRERAVKRKYKCLAKIDISI
jgi:hypothetical protein